MSTIDTTRLHSLHLARMLSFAGERFDLEEAQQVAHEIRTGDWPVDPAWTPVHGKTPIDALVGNQVLAHSQHGLEILGALVSIGCRPKPEMTGSTSLPITLFLDGISENEDHNRKLWAGCMILKVASRGDMVIQSHNECRKIIDGVGGWGGRIQGMDMAAWIGLQASVLGGHGKSFVPAGETETLKKKAARILQRVLEGADPAAKRTDLEAWLVKRGAGITPISAGGSWANQQESRLKIAPAEIPQAYGMLEEARGLERGALTQKAVLQLMAAAGLDCDSKGHQQFIFHALDVVDQTPNGLAHACHLDGVRQTIWGPEGPTSTVPGTRAIGKAMIQVFDSFYEHSTPWNQELGKLKQWLDGAGNEAFEGAREAIKAKTNWSSRKDEKVAAWQSLVMHLNCNRVEPDSTARSAPRL